MLVQNNFNDDYIVILCIILNIIVVIYALSYLYDEIKQMKLRKF